MVTEDETVDALGEVVCKTPIQARAWLNEGEASDRSGPGLPFIDLATQQAKLRPQIEPDIERVLRHGH